MGQVVPFRRSKKPKTDPIVMAMMAWLYIPLFWSTFFAEVMHDYELRSKGTARL